MKLLATTALEETWGNGDSILFLGEWCRLYDRRDVWEKRPHEIVRNHWDDRKKLKRDHGYLKGLHDALLADLTRELNRYQGLDYSQRYWQMILDPWLLTYVSVIWDRWECLRLAFEEHDHLETIAIELGARHKPCFDYTDSIEKILNDSWNYRLFLEIVESNYSDRCIIRRCPAEAPPSADFGADALINPREERLRDRIFRFLDALLARLPIQNQVVFYQSYFPPLALLRLNLNLNQLARWYLTEFRAPIASGGMIIGDEQDSARESLALQLKPNNSFESFLLNRIIHDIPSLYLEGYSALRAEAGRIYMKPRIILTANAHWGNELFKFWSAEQVYAGAKFIVMTHGGSIPLLIESMSFEDDIADIKTTWAIPCHQKQVRLPPNKLVAKRFCSTREYLAIIGNEMPRYQYRAQSTPHCGQTLVSCDMVCELYSLLAKKIQASFLIRPYPNRGWNTRQRFIDKLGSNRVSKESDYKRFLAQARVIVCTYPETTFSEAIASGLPAILFYPTHLWEPISKMNPLLEIMRSAQMVFDDPGAAAAHINAIWASPERWWDSRDVINARNEFNRQALDLSGDWLKQWTLFIEGQTGGADN
jgi:putative transferase (TIGR04331 family)